MQLAAHRRCVHVRASRTQIQTTQQDLTTRRQFSMKCANIRTSSHLYTVTEHMQEKQTSANIHQQEAAWYNKRLQLTT